MILPIISIKTMILNIILFYPTLILGGYLLWVKSIPFSLLYSITLIFTIIICRYLICRSCYYYGKPCPSFGFSYLALMFSKGDDKPFNGKAALIETRIITACLLLPIFFLVLSWFGVIETYSISAYILIGIYVIFAISMAIVHDKTGCDKCEIEDCPLSRASKIKQI